jgi:Raf kinase inhibitor-like YbhB/YbcL family protein
MMAFTLSSADFAAGGEIPRDLTCEGANVSPALAWSDVPAAAKSLVLLVDDPDAPDPRAPRTTWAHWLLYDLPPTLTSLVRGVTRAALPPEAREGVNDWHRTGYGGPCPPIGRHRYFHHLFALDVVLGDLGAPNRTHLLGAIKGHVLAEATLIGTYEKRNR